MRTREEIAFERNQWLKKAQKNGKPSEPILLLEISELLMDIRDLLSTK